MEKGEVGAGKDQNTCSILWTLIANFGSVLSKLEPYSSENIKKSSSYGGHHKSSPLPNCAQSRFMDVSAFVCV